MNKLLSIILVLLLLAAGVTGAFHHHTDGTDHPDCSICAGAHHHSDSSSLPSLATVPVTFIRTVFILSDLIAPAEKSYSPANNRAPPA